MSKSKDNNNLDKINAILSVILQDLQKFHQQPPLVCHQRKRWSRSQYLKGAFQFINSETCCRHVQAASSCVLWECSSQNLVVNCWQIVWLFSCVQKCFDIEKSAMVPAADKTIHNFQHFIIWPNSHHNEVSGKNYDDGWTFLLYWRVDFQCEISQNFETSEAKLKS